MFLNHRLGPQKQFPKPPWNSQSKATSTTNSSQTEPNSGIRKDGSPSRFYLSRTIPKNLSLVQFGELRSEDVSTTAMNDRPNVHAPLPSNRLTLTTTAQLAEYSDSAFMRHSGGGLNHENAAFRIQSRLVQAPAIGCPSSPGGINSTYCFAVAVEAVEGATVARTL